MTYKIRKARITGFKTYREASDYAKERNIKNASYGYSKKTKYIMEYDMFPTRS
jgi:hypothetical protein